MNKLFNLYKRIEKQAADHPIAFALISFLIASSTPFIFFYNNTIAFCEATLEMKGYILFVIIIASLSLPSMFFGWLLTKRKSFKQNIIDELEALNIKLSHDNLITDSYNLKYYPNSVLECYYSYSFILDRLVWKYGDEYKLFPIRLTPIVQGKDWVPFDKVVALHSDIKSILNCLKKK